MRKVPPFWELRTVLAAPDGGLCGSSLARSQSRWEDTSHKITGAPHKPSCRPSNQSAGRPPAHSLLTIQDEAVHELITKQSYLQNSVHTFEKLTKLSSMYHKLLDQNIKNGIKLYISLLNSFQKD